MPITEEARDAIRSEIRSFMANRPELFRDEERLIETLIDRDLKERRKHLTQSVGVFGGLLAALLIYLLRDARETATQAAATAARTATAEAITQARSEQRESFASWIRSTEEVARLAEAQAMKATTDAHAATAAAKSAAREATALLDKNSGLNERIAAFDRATANAGASFVDALRKDPLLLGQMQQAWVPIGCVTAWPSSGSVPAGWRACNGDAIAALDTDPIKTVLGTTYGDAGPGKVKLPDFRGCFLRGEGIARDSTGKADTHYSSEPLGKREDDGFPMLGWNDGRNAAAGKDGPLYLRERRENDTRDQEVVPVNYAVHWIIRVK